KLDDKVADDLNLAWHRIDTWPDVVPGFLRLQRKFMLAPCSNGNIALMVDIARRNKFSWDAVLGSEIARDFKPKPAVYLMTAAALNLRPEQVMMCAAHSDDLRSAASNGLRTADIARPGENGPAVGDSNLKDNPLGTRAAIRRLQPVEVPITGQNICAALQ